MKCSSNEIQLMTEMFESFPAYKKDGWCHSDCLQAYGPGVKLSSFGEVPGSVTYYGKLQVNLISYIISYTLRYKEEYKKQEKSKKRDGGHAGSQLQTEVCQKESESSLKLLWKGKGFAKTEKNDAVLALLCCCSLQDLSVSPQESWGIFVSAVLFPDLAT